MSDLIALWIGRCVMALAGFGVVTFLGWFALQMAWVTVIRPAALTSDFLAWKRAKANGTWGEPRVKTPGE